MGVREVESVPVSGSVSVTAFVPQPLADGLKVLARRRYTSVSAELRLAVARHLASERVLSSGPDRGDAA